MAAQYILSFIADDRPGLVDSLAQVVAELDGNWLESRMANMAEKFAGIARVELPNPDKAEALKTRLRALETDGFRILLAEARQATERLGAALVIDLVGPDHPGIVRDVTHCLAVHRVSVESMETHTEDAPMGGGALFHAHVEARLPADVTEEKLLRELEQLASTLVVDLHFRKNGAD
ncbi:glycine cleavage system protein R [Mesorhizobium sp. 10J20-29]